MATTDTPLEPPRPASTGLTEGDWQRLVASIHGGYCVPILGPEVRPGTLQMRAEVAAEFGGAEFPFASRRGDLVQVAQFLSINRGHPRAWRDQLAAELQTRLGRLGAAQPGDPYAVLARLPLSCYVTTNMDVALAAALRAENRRVHEEICPWWARARPDQRSRLRDPGFELSPAEPVVFYLFGNTTNPDSLVLTEDDHLDFLVRVGGVDVDAVETEGPDHTVLPNKLTGRLTSDYLLFLGYNLGEFDFRILLRALRQYLQMNTEQNITGPVLIAVQLDPASPPQEVELLQRYLEASCLQYRIRVAWGRCADFVGELGRRYADYRQTHAPVPTGAAP